MKKKEIIIALAIVVLGVTQYNTNLKLEAITLQINKELTTTKPVDEDGITWNDFVEAVIFIESKGDDSAYNEKEKAVGCLQIRPIMVRELNRQLTISDADFRYTLKDRWNRRKSVEMFEVMAEQVQCCEGLTQMEFFEIVARRWNGGGRGEEKTATLVYWNKIKSILI
tara:strand:- start:7972 stop:8475 length:504 start_codon:yes stop_codon:yes gene_type:complete